MADAPAATGAETTADGTDEQPQSQDTIFGCPVVDVAGSQVVFVPRDSYLDTFRAAREDGYELLIDLTAVDYIAHPGRTLPAGVQAERFEVVVNLLDIVDRRRLRFRIQVPGDDPRLPSLFDIWPGSDAFERETYDMFGIAFDGHPDLTRILMPEDWEGHPLRKDYSVGRVPVQFKDTPGAR